MTSDEKSAAPEAPETSAAVPAEPTDAQAAKAKRLEGETGALRLPSLKDVAEAGEAVARNVRRLLGTEVQRVRDLDSPAAREAAGKMGRAIDRAKKRLGEMTPELVEALRATGGVGFAKWKAAREAIRLITPRAGSNVRY